MNAHTLIFGATGATGLEISRILAGRGERVTAVVRESSDTSALELLGVDTVVADLFDPAGVDELLSDSDASAAILSLSSRRGAERHADLEGASNIIDAAHRHGPKRLLMITAIGCGDSRSIMAPKVIEVLGETLSRKSAAEEYLLESGADATILRPGGLTDDPASGTAIKTPDHNVMGVAHRADVAQLTVDCIDDTATIGNIYHTIDPAIKWQPPLQRGEDIPRKD